MKISELNYSGHSRIEIKTGKRELSFIKVHGMTTAQSLRHSSQDMRKQAQRLIAMADICDSAAVQLVGKKPVFPTMERGPNIEVGTGRPGYRWVQGWIVRFDASRVSMPMIYREARATLKEAKK